MERGPDSRNSECRMSWNRLAGEGVGSEGAAHAFGDMARGYAFGRVAASTRRTHEANW